MATMAVTRPVESDREATVAEGTWSARRDSHTEGIIAAITAITAGAGGFDLKAAPGGALMDGMDTPSDGARCVIGYSRVSSEDQAANGVSLDAQRHRIESYCEAHNLRLLSIEKDAGISAKTMQKRPGLQMALQALKTLKASGLVVLKLDRLSRTTRDVLDLAERAQRERWQLHSIDERLDTSSPQGRFTLTLLAALAQMEREQVGARTKAAMAELRRQGRRTSRYPPFGYRFKGDRLVKVAREQKILRRMLELQADGNGCWRIARVLNGEGKGNPRTGRAW
jgi:DNA invertase Pin-like site-specific DNA recombinase